MEGSYDTVFTFNNEYGRTTNLQFADKKLSGTRDFILPANIEPTDLENVLFLFQKKLRIVVRSGRYRISAKRRVLGGKAIRRFVFHQTSIATTALN